MTTTPTPAPASPEQLTANIEQWSRELGFQQSGITNIDLQQEGAQLREWLAKKFHGSMAWMEDHGDMRWHPEKLLPRTVSVISVRMNYLPPNTRIIAQLRDGNQAYLSRYALGRDYHKLIRKRLSLLADKIADAAQCRVAQRPFVDSAPVMEKPLAANAGLGWIGKNTLLLNRDAGSWFFLGELFTSLPLPTQNTRAKDECGNCRACLKICPTQAFPEPYVLDARRCISYLTIEHKDSIPVEFRKAMGNRVFGCDDCQIVCPWNRFAQATSETHFKPRHGLADSDLATLFNWSESQFLDRTAGSPIRRIGYQRWLRNLAIGLGNAPTSAPILSALKARINDPSPLVREHVAWALTEHQKPVTAC